MGALFGHRADQDFIWRVAGVALVTCGAIGAVAGLVIGLFSYAPTAVFAAVELGLPSAVVGGLVGSLVGFALRLTARTRPSPGVPTGGHATSTELEVDS